MIITSINQMSEGLFGQIILFVFEILPILEDNDYEVNNLLWKISTTNYGNIFPNVLEYKANVIIDEIKKHNVISLENLRKQRPQYVLGDNFYELNKLFFKYFNIPNEYYQYAEDLNLSEFVGFHFRGTDKTVDTIMNTSITKKDFLQIFHEYITLYNIKKVFIATDEKDLFDYLFNKYKDIEFKSSRNFNKNIFWRNNQNKLQNAKEAMQDMVCLSKCNEVIKVSSALSAFSKLINPDLKIYRLNALKMFADIPYFPDAYIPLFEKNVKYTKECNNIIHKIQLNDWSFSHKKKFNNFICKKR